jgi:predicted double-glycine peptidase
MKPRSVEIDGGRSLVVLKIIYMCLTIISISLLNCRVERNGPVSDAGKERAHIDHPRFGYDERLCGPVSLYHALLALGVPSSLDAVVSECSLTPEGTSMLDLRNAAERMGLIADGRTLDWAELKEAEGVAVLYVKGNHFIFSNSHPTPRNLDDNEILIKDGNATSIISKDQLMDIWKGETLVLRRPGKFAYTGSGAFPLFDTLVANIGRVEDRGVTEVIFPFSNVGRDVLEIHSLKTSCGCSKAVVDKDNVKPGESARIALEIDVTEKKSGAFSTAASLISNAEDNNIIRLYVEGDVIRTELFDEDRIHLGRLDPGESAVRNIRLFPEYPDAIHIESADFVPSGREVPTQLSIVAQLTSLETEKSTHKDVLTSNMNGSEYNDFYLEIRGTPSMDSLSGAFEGVLTLRFRDGESQKKEELIVSGFVNCLIDPAPDVVYVLWSEGLPETLTRHIGFASDYDFALTKVSFEKGSPVVSASLDGPHAAELVMEIAAMKSDSYRDSAIFETESGERITIPIRINRVSSVSGQ